VIEVIEESDHLVETPSEGEDDGDIPQRPILPEGLPCLAVEFTLPTRHKKDTCIKPKVAVGKVHWQDIVYSTLTHCSRWDVMSARIRVFLNAFHRSLNTLWWPASIVQKGKNTATHPLIGHCHCMT
jgi:hypothetical protein